MKKNIHQNFMSKLKGVLKQCPKDCWLFVNGHGIYLMKYSEDGERIIKNDCGIDTNAIMESITLVGDLPEMDGGDF